ncbi:MAG: gephyrin-like molybdotransferase Glp [Chloroflexota bacterium]
MSEFLRLLPPPQALKKFLSHIDQQPTVEKIPLTRAVGRVTATDSSASFALPPFMRSTVDGFAVRAIDTHGATESLPAYLTVVGEVEMGSTPSFEIGRGQCAIIHTGGMLPAGADAVVMVEYTQEARPGEVEILRAVSTSSSVIQPGEDVAQGDVVLPAGTRLRPTEIGGLAAIGQDMVQVAAKPRVGIISSGDEVVAPGEPIQLGQVYDVNSYSLQGLVVQAGGEPITYGILSDDAAAFKDTAAQAKAECDLVIFTAGSSVSVRDLTATTINQLGEPGILVHGVSVRPGKPTILAIADSVPIIGLPGNPVSALVIARIFVTATIDKLLGLRQSRPKPTVAAKLNLNLASQAGREDWIGVRLIPSDNGYEAAPIFGKSNLIFTLAQADGLVKIPAPANGIPAGELVTVELI